MDVLQNDKLLFERIAEGDEAAFKQLFQLYTPRLKAYFGKLTRDAFQVKELVQETFLNVWVYRNRLAAVDTPSAYLYKIAANLSVAWFRKTDLERQLVKEVAVHADKQSEAEFVSIKELRHQIDLAASSLPHQQKTVFMLSRQEGLSRTEIAQKLNLSEKTVRNHLTLALASIQEHLKHYNTIYIPLFFLEMIIC